MLFGRDSEIATVERLIARARDGGGGALIVMGEAGSGKTALLEHGRERTEGMRNLHVTGLEAESSLPFAALAELARHLLDGLPGLPGPQAAAIEGALALRPPVKGDRFAVCAGFLGLLEIAARDRPLLVTVDDAHWLDVSSRESLAFAARRVAELPVAMLASVRGADPGQFPALDVELLELGGLEPDAARSLLAQAAPELAPAVAKAVIEAAAGMPLALRELPRGLTAEQRQGLAPIEGPLAPPEGLIGSFGARIRSLPGDAEGALLVAAAALSPSLAPIVTACRELDIDPRALEIAESEGIVSLDAQRAEFSHPLYRGAAYHLSAPAARRRAHAALAATSDRDDRAWHLAAAAVGPDEEAATALELAAQRAESRGAHAAAADAYERAAALSEKPAARTERLIAAGVTATGGGAHARATALLSEAARSDDPELRGRANAELAIVTLWESGNVETAYNLLAAEADRIADTDRLRAASLLADAALAASAGHECRRALETATRARALLGDDREPTRRAQVLAVLGWSLANRGEWQRARETVAEVDELMPDVDPLRSEARALVVALNSRAPFEEYERARDECTAIAAAARDAGYLGMVPFPLVAGADAKRRLGDWDGALRDGSEAIALAEEIEQRGSLAIGLVTRALLLGCRGEETAARAAAARVRELAEPAGVGSVLLLLASSFASLELYMGRAEDAIAALQAVRETADRQGYEQSTRAEWDADLIEAYVQVGRPEAAAAVVDELERRAERGGGFATRALTTRGQALVADDFEPLFETALELHTRRPEPFQQARTLYAYGSRLHRARRRVAARDRLREALAIFERLGAAPLVERTRAELRAAGAIDRAPAADSDELTAQELRVAQAVARGLTNREVAAELFLSVKTIEFHLSRVYRKLGIRSRTELVALVAEGGLEQPDPVPPEAA